ncbi:hypothetical protein [Rickettsiella endosymbiont of Litargus connexus]|uniref:hypothetical protein n=1 Tax=Rickettsiella endosymbiont of Litargus connexus TaxID=3066237 RepID=UPI00376EC933
MDEQVSITRKEPREVGVTSEIGRNSSLSRSLVRQISLSGPGSEGEKSLLKKNPVWFVSSKAKTPIFNACLSSLDEVVATPSFNVSVIKSACDQDCKFFDDINKSKYVGYIDAGLASLGLFAVSIGIYVIKYCKLREIERMSHYFYFSRLFKADEEAIKKKMGEIVQESNEIKKCITYEHLCAAAYFYPPDIPKIACWRRRFFAFGKEKKQLKALNNFLKENTKKEMLDMLHKKSTEKVCQLLNKSKANKFKISLYKNNWIISLTNGYADNFFKHVDSLINHNSRTTLEKNKAKKNKKFIPPILAALGQASFIYWILMFIFCFIPAAPVITTALISILPLIFAFCTALPLLLFLNIKNVLEINNTNKNMTEAAINEEDKHMIEKKLVDLNKQTIFLKYLENKEANSTIELKNSPLMTDLKAVLKNRRFNKYHARCVAFLDGCFLPLFAGWLFLDGTKVILTYALCPAAVPLASFTPIGLLATAIIAGVILLMGISYGIYSAYKANQVHEVRFNDLQNKIKVLQDKVPTKKILNKSLRDYDRVLRRFSDEQPLWTNIKKGLSRFIIIIKRLGTGSLVFRLVIWSPITAAVAASTMVLPTFFPIILMIGTAIGACALATWYLYAYNLESKAAQAGRIVEHLVQSEQLAWIDKQLPAILSEECLNLHESNSKNLTVAPDKIVNCKKEDTPTECLQDNVSSTAKSINSAGVNAMTIQTETGIQKNNSNSSLHAGLFANISPYIENRNQNSDIEPDLSRIVVPSY